ncbi:hypothetical protein EYS42_16995 [Aquabacterium lacunae]|uniref:Uncharacterized protein n=1 Tax=Aquabacterium lacunae TaxID=2528630 RepID=A0A4Q9GUB3_9BURK|nr:hypothetical protein [Aquabacterium lacunae]TBO27047.1 hypothetical protein EYS42_16995 [Aquabacterium lacunae]
MPLSTKDGQAPANKAHGFAIFMGLVGALQSLRSFRRRLPWALGHCLAGLWKHYSGVFCSIARPAPLIMREWFGWLRLLPG